MPQPCPGHCQLRILWINSQKLQRDPRKCPSLPEQHVWNLLTLTKAFIAFAHSYTFLIEHRKWQAALSSASSVGSRDYKERWVSPHLPKRTALRSETKVLSVCLRTSVSSMFMWMHFLQLFAWKNHFLVKKEADLKYENEFRNGFVPGSRTWFLH